MIQGLKEKLMELKAHIDTGNITVEEANRLHAVGFALPAHDGKCSLELEVYDVGQG